MKYIVGVILLILNGLVLSGIWSCFKEAMHEAKNSRHKVLITITCFFADSWELITLAFLTLMFGLICIHWKIKIKAKYKVLGNKITAKIDIAAVVVETVLAVIFVSWYFCKGELKYGTIIEQVLLQRIISTVVVIALIIAILVFIRWALKDDGRFKLIFTISIAISIVITIVLGIGLSKIVLDIQNEDYIINWKGSSMKCFTFKKKSSNNKNIDSNGWIFNFLLKKNLGFFSLKTPIVKEVTYSKGPSVRYQRHRVLGIGIVNASNEFVGLAFFDPHIRILIFLIILFGVSYVSLSIATGLIFGSLFYLLILFLSLEEDDRLLSKCKLIFENES